MGDERDVWETVVNAGEEVINAVWEGEEANKCLEVGVVLA